MRLLDRVYILEEDEAEMRRRGDEGSFLRMAARLEGMYGDKVVFADLQVARQHYKRSVAVPTDPMYQDQFQHPMIRTPQAWQVTRGKGAIVSIVDDGVQWNHPELKEQYLPHLSANFNLESGSGVASDPSPDVDGGDFHGTACCGVSTGHNNTYCGVGSAYEASLAGVRLIGGPVDDSTEAEGITVGIDEVSVYSCSWGPNDDGKRVAAPGRVTMMALEHGVANGRGGRGSVWVWAAGNGAQKQDECNFDGYANHPLTIAVGAVGDNFKKSSYSEECSALMVVAPSNGGSKGIITCDIMGPQGYSPTECTDSFGGTSSAAPLAAGVVALMLSANPNLGWKDVQYILMTTAQQVDPTDASWETNAVGRKFSHRYGYGLIDAEAAVQEALRWSTSDRLATAIGRFSTATQVVNKPLPQGVPLVLKLQVKSTDWPCEHVQLYLTSDHPQVTELRIELTSPSGTKSILAKMRAFQLASHVMGAGLEHPSVSAAFSSQEQIPWDAFSVANVKGEACSLEDYHVANPSLQTLAGKAALVVRGNCTFIEKATLLAALGAAVVIVTDSVNGENPFQMAGSPVLKIPVCMVSKATGDLLRQMDTIQFSQSPVKADIPLEYNDWGFTSVFYWGENATGTWTLTIEDQYQGSDNEPQGQVISWRMVIWSNSSLGNLGCTVSSLFFLIFP